MFKEIRDSFMGIAMIAFAVALTQFPELAQYQEPAVYTLGALGAFLVLASQMGWKTAAYIVAGEVLKETADDAGDATEKLIYQIEENLQDALAKRGIVLDVHSALDEKALGDTVEEMLIALGHKLSRSGNVIQVLPKDGMG